MDLCQIQSFRKKIKAPHFADFFVQDTSGIVDETLTGLVSQDGVFNNRGLGKVVSHFNELTFTADDLTYHYISDFKSTVTRNLLGATSSAAVYFDHVVVEDGDDTVATLSLYALVNPDLGTATSSILVDLGGLLSDLLGGDMVSVLDGLAGSSDDLLESIQDAIDTSEEVVATEDNDVLNGADDKDNIDGLGGDDKIKGGAGNDVLHGGLIHLRIKSALQQIWGDLFPTSGFEPIRHPDFEIYNNVKPLTEPGATIDYHIPVKA